MKISSFCKVRCESLIFKVRRFSQCCIIFERFPCIICPLVKLVTIFWCYSGWLGRILCCWAVFCCDLASHAISGDFISSKHFFGDSCYSSLINICCYISKCDLVFIRDIVWLIWVFFTYYINTVIYIYRVFLRIKTNLLICSFNAFQNVMLSVKFRFLCHCSLKDLFSECTAITYNRCCCIFCYNAIGIFIEVMDLIMKISSFCKVRCESLIFKVRRFSQCCIIFERFPCIICPLVKLVTIFWCYNGWLCRMLCCWAIYCFDLISHAISGDFISSSHFTGFSCHSSLISIC